MREHLKYKMKTSWYFYLCQKQLESFSGLPLVVYSQSPRNVTVKNHQTEMLKTQAQSMGGDGNLVDPQSLT